MIKQTIQTSLICLSLLGCNSPVGSGEKTSELSGSAKIKSLDNFIAQVDLYSADTICVPAAQFSPLYGDFKVLNRAGKSMDPLVVANREVQSFKGLDVSDGLYIVSGEKRILVSLENYKFDVEHFSFHISLKYIGCSELFSTSAVVRPKILKLSGAT